MPTGSRPQSRARSVGPPTGTAPFFPRPFDGESLYSVVARYQRARQLDDVALHIDLFGMEARVFSPTLPSAVGRIAARAGIGRPGAEGMVLQHTAFRYYTATSTDDLASRLMAALLNSNGKPGMIAGQRGAPAGLLPFMRFCPECLTRMESRGETHWRLIHQLPIAMTCPDHGGVLRDSTIPGSGLIPGFQVPTPRNCPVDAKRSAPEAADAEMLGKLTLAAVATINGSRVDAVTIRAEFHRELKRQGLITSSGRFRWHEIQEEIDRRLAPIAPAFPKVAANCLQRQGWVGLQIQADRPSSSDRILMLRLALGMLD